MVEDHYAAWLNCAQDIVTSAPSQVCDGLLGRLYGWQGLPPFIRGWALSAHDLALPHDDITVLCSTAQNTLLRVVRDRVNLVIEELTLEG